MPGKRVLEVTFSAAPGGPPLASADVTFTASQDPAAFVGGGSVDEVDLLGVLSSSGGGRVDQSEEASRGRQRFFDTVRPGLCLMGLCLMGLCLSSTGSGLGLRRQRGAVGGGGWL